MLLAIMCDLTNLSFQRYYQINRKRDYHRVAHFNLSRTNGRKFRFFAATNFRKAITATLAVVNIYFNWTGFVENREQNKL